MNNILGHNVSIHLSIGNYKLFNNQGMTKKIIATKQAPAAIGPYSQATVYQGMIYCSGQIPLNAETGEIEGSDAPGQARKVMENLAAVLKAAGSDWSKVLKCTIYLTDMADFSGVNEVYGSFFQQAPPARETVAVKGLPKGVLVEISCLAHQ